MAVLCLEKSPIAARVVLLWLALLIRSKFKMSMFVSGAYEHINYYVALVLPHDAIKRNTKRAQLLLKKVTGLLVYTTAQLVIR